MRWIVICAVLGVPGASVASAQTDVPPELGGRVYSLGMPPLYKGHAGGMVGWYRPGDSSDVAFNAHLGVSRDIGSPIVGLAAVGLEGYAGFRRGTFDGGGRAFLSMPVMHVSLGADYNVPDNALDLLLRLELPIRRGGILGWGSQVRVDYLPTRRNTFTLGVSVPLWGRNIGGTRPRRDYVRLEEPPLQRLELAAPHDDIVAALADARTSALWLTRMVMPFVDRGGKEPSEAYAEPVGEIRERLTERSLPEEVLAYHAALERAFSVATSGQTVPEGEVSTQGRAAARAARAVLLEHVLFPYNRLLGQRKVNDGLDQFRAVAQVRFVRWLLNESGLTNDRFRETFYVFQSLVDITDAVRAMQRERWKDSRFVWLPLQLGLTPDEHDTQQELDHIIERAVNAQFTEGNDVWYVMNESFQFEMARSVLRAEDYHVLWIHDYRGKNDAGKPDRLAFEHTVGSYIRALTHRVRAYDETGKLPVYMIFLDQHYFEVNKARMFLRVLQDPLHYELHLPDGYEAWEQQLEAAQDSLRAAVAGSRLLQAELSQYGEQWLANRIKVHVSITNPSDFSFHSLHVAGIVPIPDNMIRDHRKIAFYDLTDADPYRGLAMYTGMGIGEHYVGPAWEDRAIMIRGPAALAARDAAVRLLRAQGFTEDEIPLPLRAQPKPPDYAARVAAYHAATTSERGTDPGRALELHNATGYAPKSINVAKAVLYSLMPAGSVLKIPDSLWQSYVYGSLLAGSALRGCIVMIVAPSKTSAPSAAAPTLARAYGLLSALVYLRNGLADAIAAEGGHLLLGLYHPQVGVGDLRGRLLQSWETHETTELGAIDPPTEYIREVFDELDAILDSAGYVAPTYLATGDTTGRPKLHLKANVFISREAWQALDDRPEWGPIFREYIRYLAAQTGPPEERPDIRVTPVAMEDAVKALIVAVRRDADPALRGRGIGYLTVGSANMDYRSMVMDGEVMITVTSWHAVEGLVDFAILEGLTEWIDDQEDLDALLPPPSGFARSIANLIKLAL